MKINVARRWGPVAALGAAVFVTLALPAARMRAAPQADERVRHVFATVTDGKGVPVKHLGVRDFTVAEDGQTREILRVTPSTALMQIALLVDTSDPTFGRQRTGHSRSSMASTPSSTDTQPHVLELRKGLTMLIQEALASNPRTELAFYTFGARPVLQVDYTSSSSTLLGAAAAMTIVKDAGAYLEDAIREACRTLKPAPGVRPVIVAFVDERSHEYSTLDHVAVARVLAEAGASLWTATLEDPTAADDTTRQQPDYERTRVLDEVTVNSGGENVAIISPQDLEGVFDRLTTLIIESYDIAYTRAETAVTPKRLEVRLNGRSGVQLLAPHFDVK